jgi:4-hydroxy 2-oxovalerate aldolase
VTIKLLDCTLRDGGYYNNWDFPRPLIEEYLTAVQAAGVDIVELGFRFLDTRGFRGACAYTTDSFLQSLDIPPGLTVGVMLNGSDLLGDTPLEQALEVLFPLPADETPVDLVRIACHAHEFTRCLPACAWLKERGYQVGFNLMQVTDRSEDEVVALGEEAAKCPIDALYFADSMGSMTPERAEQILGWFRRGWRGAIGIHTHDNMGYALSNTLRAIDCGASWVDATVTGMGRGPGNARTEELVIELAERRGGPVNFVPLFTLVRDHFGPMKAHYGWGTNPYYFLAGKHGIHPTFIQQMMGDSRYTDEDVIAVIDRLSRDGGKKFSAAALDAARHGAAEGCEGSWAPAAALKDREVLLLGAGPGVADHRDAIESYIRRQKPVVMALNTQGGIAEEMIDLRLACHPLRLVADARRLRALPQPLIAPKGLLTEEVIDSLRGKEILDFGLQVKSGTFEARETGCAVPVPLVSAYALAAAWSGGAERVLMAGFDGYPEGDSRNSEMRAVLTAYFEGDDRPDLVAITPSRFVTTEKQSVYGLIR